MRILAFDSTGPLLSVGVAADGQPLCRRDMKTERGKGYLLEHAIDAVLRDVDWSRNDVEGLAILTGPGSLTSMRIGWATAVGWAQSAGLPVTGQTVPAVHRRMLGRDAKDTICCIHYRGDSFLLYDLGSSAHSPQTVSLTPDAHTDRAPRVLTGPGVLGYRDQWSTYFRGATRIVEDADAIVGADTLAVWGEADILAAHLLDLRQSPLDYGVAPDFKKLIS